jgi:hypothetical protein
MRRALAIVLVLSANVRAEPPPKPHASLATALGWSIGVTAFGVGMGFATARATVPGEQDALLSFSGLSLLAGPSIGRFYTGNYLTAGLVVRAVGLGVFAMSQGLNCLPETGPAAHPTCDSHLAMNGFSYLGAGLMVLGGLWDLASIPGDVAEYNAHAALMPTALRTPNGVVPGLALAGEF